MAIQVSSAEFRNPIYSGESFSLEIALTWIHLVAHQEHTNMFKQMLFPASRTLRAIFPHLPLREVDTLATGIRAPFFQEWLEQSQPGSEYWQTRSFDATVKEVEAPVNLIGGWYDIFLPWQLRDYRALRDAGKHPSLTIGPWEHTSPELNSFSIRESLTWLHAQLREDRSQLRAAPVRVFVTGANEWRELSDWPPPGSSPQRWHLQPGKALTPDLPPLSEPDRYRYDPANPTPALAGPLLGGKSLPTDNRRLEERADVLTYTSAPLGQDLDAIGPVQADLYVQSSLEHTDFFVRLCDVDTRGRSINVCDALLRVIPGRPAPLLDGTLRVSFDLWPIAHRFCTGHRLRLQISSGAHPRFARNTGSGEPLSTAAKLLVADQTIYHGPEHPSGIVLSVLPAGQMGSTTTPTI
jgi:putative CocE/NonD family hydrolase